MFRKTWIAAGVINPHIDDILWCAELDVLSEIRTFPERRSGELKLQESSFAHVGMKLAQESDFSVTLAQDEFAKNLQLLPTSPHLIAARHETPPIEDIKLRQCMLGEICWSAAVSRPDICARSARIASRVDSLQGSDVYRINDLTKPAKVWQKAAILRYFSSSHTDTHARGDVQRKMRQRGEKIHCGP